MHINRIPLVVAFCAALSLPSSVAQPAPPVVSGFYITLDGNNVVDPTQSGGTGYPQPSAEGIFYEYPDDPAGGVPWWNQWFFNSAQIAGSKWITYDIVPTPGLPLPPPDTLIEIAINYTTPSYTNPLQPPLPGTDPEQFIIRENIFTGSALEVAPGINNLDAPLLITTWNPVWVSIDIRVTDSTTPEPVYLTGTIVHQHVPEPHAYALMAGVGLLGFAAWRRRRS